MRPNSRGLAVFAAALLTAAGLGATAHLADAASTSGVHIVAIYFDPPGPDSHYSYNTEWVKLKNVTGSSKDITDWTLRDASSHVYRIPATHLAAGATIRVHTGSGTENATNLYWGSHWWIWNDSGDTSTLRNAGGTTVDTCSYKSSAAPEASC